MTFVLKVYGVSYSGVRFGGHNLWPLKFVTQLYHLAKSKFDLNLHTGTPVTSVSQISSADSYRRWSVNSPRGSVKCNYVIYATNGYTSHLLPHMHGPAGIIPTRGQIIALRAAASLPELTKASWSGNEGFEYWFPRPVKISEDTRTEENPLVILGGGREVSRPSFEYYETDDSSLNPKISKALKDFLPGVFPGKFEKGREPELEWVS